MGPNAGLYTPQLFTETLYGAETFFDLASVVETRSVTVNLSYAKYDKPLTIEFRQHHGTVDPTAIKWWTLFLGALLKYAYSLAQSDIQVRDDDEMRDVRLDPQRKSFVENYSRDNSILDIVSFPEPGKRHFEEMKVKYRDESHDQLRELDLFIIEQRADFSRRTGKLAKRVFEKELKLSEKYKKEVERLETKYGRPIKVIVDGKVEDIQVPVLDPDWDKLPDGDYHL